MTQQMYPVVILAGGLATRLYPLTKQLPKSLIQINGQPFIHHQLRWLQGQGVRKVVICAGYLGEQIEDLVGNGSKFNLQVTYVYDGDTLQGTGGAISGALPHLDDNFFILYGDSFLNCDFAAIAQHFKVSNKLGLMTVFHNQGQWDKSNIEFDGEAILVYDKVKSSPNMQYIDYGLGILTRQAFQICSLKPPFDLATLYQSLLQKNLLAAYEVHHRFYEIGSFAGIKELEYHLSGLS